MKSKRCTKCGRVKPLSEFHKDKRNKNGHQSWCKECDNARARAWYAENRGKKAATFRKYREADPEREAARLREWKRENPEKARAKNRRAGRRRRVCRAGAVGSHTEAEFKALVKTVGGHCPCCGRKFGLLLRPTRDHIIPLIKGGSNDITNIQPLCMRCNDSKGTKTIDYR